MPIVKPSIVVFGGNGFLGSAVCRRAISKGIEVTSISSSGRPFTTPKGHRPAWTEKVKWHAASAFNPTSYRSLLEGKTAVVHTLGVLLEGGYKSSVRNNNPLELIGSFVRNGGLSTNNPLKNEEGEYERMNRDSAISVANTFRDASPANSERTFVYISAEDIFRPVVPSRYIETKRQAESALSVLSQETPTFRSVFIRPGLMYHPHLRPLTTPIAVLLDLSSRLHKNPPFDFSNLLPASILRSLAGGARQSGSKTLESSSRTAHPVIDSIANMMETPPLHVDHVADSIIAIIQHRGDIKGPVGVEDIRSIIGWDDKVDLKAST